jgi:hypothetical protein
MATYMKVIDPLSITDGMVGSGAGTVPEVEHPEWAGATTYNALQRVIVKGTQGTFTDLGLAAKQWAGMCTAPNGDVYASVFGGSIWIQSGGVGPFVDLATGNKDWTGMAAAPNGDIYCSVYNGSIWKRTAGAGAFADLTTGNKAWEGMTAAPNGDIYACVSGVSIWMQTAGVGSFADLGAAAGNKVWEAMCAAPNGDVYACTYGGSIWKRTGGAGNFADLSAGNKNWCGMTAAQNGDVYACVYGGSIWKQTGGTGSFVDLVTGNKDWRGMASAQDPNAFSIYAGVFAGSVWVSTLEVVHKIYESIVAGNIARYPPIDVRQTTPQWLEISSTNKWKCLDQTRTVQTEYTSPISYVITPGVALDSIALLNLEMTSYRVQGTSGAYDTGTVSSTATDIVLTSLGGLADNVITITITNSAGLAKVGEIILGNAYTLGTFRPGPSVGITDYSVKEQDEFGAYTIVPRSFSKKMTCGVQIAVASVDAVFNKLAAYRTTPLVWIGSATYSSLIVFGFYKDFSIVFSSNRICDCSLEIEGLT